MKRSCVLRALLGFPLGISIGFVISIIGSIAFGNGYYSPCTPALIERMGSEINAVILQTALSGVLGSVFAASSIIWQMENWSIAKQTGIYFVITALAMMPIAYYANWMDHSVGGFIAYFGIFVIIFVVMWIVQYLIWKNKIDKMNRSIKEIGDKH